MLSLKRGGSIGAGRLAFNSQGGALLIGISDQVNAMPAELFDRTHSCLCDPDTLGRVKPALVDLPEGLTL